MGKRLLTPSHPHGDTRCPGEMSPRCPRAAAEQARPAAPLLLSPGARGGSSSRSPGRRGRAAATMPVTWEIIPLLVGVPVLIRVPDRTLGQVWRDRQTDRELGLTEISYVASFPFLLSRMKNYPSEASRKFRNY